MRPLIEAIQRFLDSWNDDRKPFVWLKSTDEILATYTANVPVRRWTRTA